MSLTEDAKDLLRRSPLRRMIVNRRHRGLKAEDVFIASFPRSGNTWMRFVLADIFAGERISFRSVEEIMPGVGHHEGAPGYARGGGRLIKTHEPWRPEYRRGVYLVRDVRDVLMSYYRMHQSLQPDLALDTFVDRFVRGQVDGYGSWQDHVEGWLGAAGNGCDLLVIRYEDLRADPIPEFQKAAAFVGTEVDADRVQRALDDNSVENLREREQQDAEYLSKAMGWKGALVSTTQTTVGGREQLTEAQLAKIAPMQRLFDAIA